MSSSNHVKKRTRASKESVDVDVIDNGRNQVTNNDTDKKLVNEQTKPNSRIYSFILRFITGLIMIIAFGFILYTNHLVISCFVVVLQILVFREIIAIRYKEAKEKNLLLFRTLNWYFLFITMYFIYGPKFLTILDEYFPVPTILIQRHYWNSFVLYILGFCGFVFSLRYQTLKYQFSQITWTIMTLLLVVVQSHFVLRNIHEGLIWFILPHSLIICNDIWAYFVGFAIGKKFIKRPLTRLSPNKSWEGFFGAIIITVIYSFIAARVFGNFEWFRCSAAQIASDGGCPKGHLFTPLPITEVFKDFVDLSMFKSLNNIYITRMQVHSVIFALFASVIAPFGGFFASAMKRAYSRKDFDAIFPGHGGATDRFDCQFIMGMFIFVYYITWIKKPMPDIDYILTLILNLPAVDRQRIMYTIERSLQS